MKPEFKQLQSEINYLMGNDIPKTGAPIIINSWHIWFKLDLLVATIFPLKCTLTCLLNEAFPKKNFCESKHHFYTDYINSLYESSIMRLCTILDDSNYKSNTSLRKCFTKLDEYTKNLTLVEYCSYFEDHNKDIATENYLRYIGDKKSHLHIKKLKKRLFTTLQKAHDFRDKYLGHSEINFDLEANSLKVKELFELIDTTIEIYTFVSDFTFSSHIILTRYEKSIYTAFQFIDYFLDISPIDAEKYVYQTRNKIQDMSLTWSLDQYSHYKPDHLTA